MSMFQNKLTATEKKVAYHTACGMIAKEIADNMCVSYHTIHTHLKNIRNKTGAKNIADITRMYILNLENPKAVFKALLFFVIQMGMIYSVSDVQLRRLNRSKNYKTYANRYVRSRANFS